jgi:hypothetical protein
MRLATHSARAMHSREHERECIALGDIAVA